jgi:hypothetical protein
MTLLSHHYVPYHLAYAQQEQQFGYRWSQRGGDIDGEAEYDYSGSSVSLSADGNVLAIGADGSDGNGSNAGHVRVYDWNITAGDWSQRGGDIDGETAGDWSGSSVSLSADGNVVAIGADGNDENGENAGHVRVYEWNVSAGDWNQRGGDIDGEARRNKFGTAVSLSADGYVLAIGADNHDYYRGHVRVYEWNVSAGDWSQRFGDIDGEEYSDKAGSSVSLSADGTVVAIGSPGNDEYGGLAGQVHLWRGRV